LNVRKFEKFSILRAYFCNLRLLGLGLFTQTEIIEIAKNTTNITKVT